MVYFRKGECKENRRVFWTHLATYVISGIYAEKCECKVFRRVYTFFTGIVFLGDSLKGAPMP